MLSAALKRFPHPSARSLRGSRTSGRPGWREICSAYICTGSLALGRFAEPVSDLDLLIVTGRRMPRRERLSVAAAVLEADRKPCPLEMSALYIGDLRPWRHPAVCQFHYSGMWSDTYRRLLDGG